MPNTHVLPAAGRYDLHHAIVYNGGYRAVAEELDRRPVRGARDVHVACIAASMCLACVKQACPELHASLDSCGLHA